MARIAPGSRRGGVLNGGQDLEFEIRRWLSRGCRQDQASSHWGELGRLGLALPAGLQVLLQRSGLIGVQGAEGPSGDLGMFEGVLGVIRHENLLGNKVSLLGRPVCGVGYRHR